MDEHSLLLQREVAGEEGTFSFKLRFQRDWDPALFNQLVYSMYQIASACRGREYVEKWLAAGFYFCATTLPRWSSEPSFPRRYDPAYYDYADSVLDALNTFLFRDRDAIECGISLGIDDAISRLNGLTE